MSSRPQKSYRVTFTATSGYKITLDAKSEYAAIAAAQKLWATEGEAAFNCFVGDTDAWSADRE
jgi:hypothetical protein